MHLVNNNKDTANELLKDHIDYLKFYDSIYKVFDDKNRFKSKYEAIQFMKDTIQRYSHDNVFGLMSSCEKTFKFDVIVSFTTYLERMLHPDIWKFLDSIVGQKCDEINYHIVCTLFKNDFD